MTEHASAACLRHEVHVWLARPEPCPLPVLAERYEALLSQQERQRSQRFHFEHDRQHYLAAHALLRLGLAHYLGGAPQHIRLAPGRNGKPELAPQHASQPLRFNLSHTRGMVACVLTHARDCGIDVEGIHPMQQMGGVAGTVFSKDEQAYLAGSEEAARTSVFFTLWTLKEAYIKATGLGMSAPLRQISIDPQGLRVRDESRPDPESDSRQWLFDSWQPTPDHALALACEGAATVRTIIYHELDLADGSLHVLLRRQVNETLA